MFSKMWIKPSTSDCSGQINQLKQALQRADAVVIGAGAGLSTSAGFTYTGSRFSQYFSDFENTYGFHDMYSGGFYPFGSLEEYWAYWSRYIFINRYQPAPRSTYQNLLHLVQDKDYFVLTTNVDHQFQQAGFDKKRLFYTQGDYGLFQCSVPCHQETYDNKSIILQMVHEQKNMRVPRELVPYCPICGKPMTMNLRCDNTFVQDAGWYAARSRYKDFIRRHKHLHVLFLELGVGQNTPVIIKYPFWRYTAENPNAMYACINAQDVYAPHEIASHTIGIKQDIHITIQQLMHI